MQWVVNALLLSHFHKVLKEKQKSTYSPMSSEIYFKNESKNQGILSWRKTENFFFISGPTLKEWLKEIL